MSQNPNFLSGFQSILILASSPHNLHFHLENNDTHHFLSKTPCELYRGSVYVIQKKEKIQNILHTNTEYMENHILNFKHDIQINIILYSEIHQIRMIYQYIMMKL